MEELSQVALESDGQLAVEEVQEGVDEGGWNGDQAQPDDLNATDCTLWTKRERLRSTMALTMRPLTEAR